MIPNPIIPEAPMANAIDDVKEWVLVPKVPTEAMYNAGYDATRKPDGFPQFADAGFVLGHSGTIYSAMLAAAPPSPAPSQHTGWSDEAVEAAARAIYEEDDDWSAAFPFDAIAEFDKDTYRVFAHAALKATSLIAPATGFQDRVAAAHVALFHGDPTDLAERRDRFGEEANEVQQALGQTREDAYRLVDYTYDRPAGEPEKEIGAAALTLASLCVVGGWDMMACAEADLAALVTPEKIAKVRAKRSTRHGRGPLPGISPSVAKESGEP